MKKQEMGGNKNCTMQRLSGQALNVLSFQFVIFVFTSEPNTLSHVFLECFLFLLKQHTSNSIKPFSSMQYR